MTTPELRQKEAESKIKCKKCGKYVERYGFSFEIKEIGKLKKKCKKCIRGERLERDKRPDVIKKEQARAKQRTASGEWKERYKAKKAGGNFKKERR